MSQQSDPVVDDHDERSMRTTTGGAAMPPTSSPASVVAGLEGSIRRRGVLPPGGTPKCYIPTTWSIWQRSRRS